MSKSLFHRIFPWALWLVLGAGLAVAQPVRTPQVEAELVAERAAVVPGSTATVALRLGIAKDWHTYWQNAGDSGLPTTLKWTLPAGVSAGPIQWPYPEAIAVGPLMNYGYHGQVLHLVEVAIPATASPGSTLRLAARADWLVCKETCIPEGADLAIDLPVGPDAGPPTRWASAFAATREALPKALPAGWQASAEGAGQRITLRIVPPPGVELATSGARFFPAAEGRVEAAGRQTVASDGGGATFTLPVASQLADGFTRLAGVVVAPRGWSSTGKALSVDVPLVGAVVAGPTAFQAAATLDLSGGASATDGAGGLLAAVGGAASLSLWVALISALAGGVLLNLMPCVFPVLSLKLLSFATHGHRPARELAGKGFAFSAGVLVSFWLLAGLLVALKAAGQQLGWGFQLQSPPVIAALAILFFVLALNLSGVYELRGVVPGSVAGWTSRRPLADAFASGVLAVVIASPCTAPFMGAALGYALAQTPVATFAVFTALGAGMAVPFLALSLFPAWRRWLPKPGPWMQRMRQLLAFPLYATVIWLAWVLGVQLGVDAMMRLAVVLLVLALAAWLLAAHGVRRSATALGFGIASLAAAAVIAWPVFSGALEPDLAAAGAARPGAAKTGAAGSAGIDRLGGDVRTAGTAWETYSAQRIADLNTAGRAVFVDFTAAWCVTCQVNKQLVLSRDSVLAAFRDRQVTLMRADWTRYDPEITRALQSLGRNGVPVYALYRPGKATVLLPELLQEASIRGALASL